MRLHKPAAYPYPRNRSTSTHAYKQGTRSHAHRVRPGTDIPVRNRAAAMRYFLSMMAMWKAQKETWSSLPRRNIVQYRIISLCNFNDRVGSAAHFRRHTARTMECIRPHRSHDWNIPWSCTATRVCPMCIPSHLNSVLQPQSHYDTARLKAA